MYNTNEYLNYSNKLKAPINKLLSNRDQKDLNHYVFMCRLAEIYVK